MAVGHCGFPSPLTGGGDPAAPPQESGVLRTGNVAQGLEAMSPQLVTVKEISRCGWRRPIPAMTVHR